MMIFWRYKKNKENRNFIIKKHFIWNVIWLSKFYSKFQETKKKELELFFMYTQKHGGKEF